MTVVKCKTRLNLILIFITKTGPDEINPLKGEINCATGCEKYPHRILRYVSLSAIRCLNDKFVLKSTGKKICFYNYK